MRIVLEEGDFFRSWSTLFVRTIVFSFVMKEDLILSCWTVAKVIAFAFAFSPANNGCSSTCRNSKDMLQLIDEDQSICT